MGYELHFHDEIGEITKNGREIAIAPITNYLYTVHLERIRKISHSGRCIHDWHRIFGHRNLNSVKDIIKDHHLKVVKCSCENSCRICQEGKMTRKPFAKSKPFNSKVILDLDINWHQTHNV